MYLYLHSDSPDWEKWSKSISFRFLFQ